MPLLLGRAAQSQIIEATEGGSEPGRAGSHSPGAHSTRLSGVFTLHHSVGAIILVENGLAHDCVIIHRFSNSVMETR